mgnify:FL=1
MNRTYLPRIGISLVLGILAVFAFATGTGESQASSGAYPSKPVTIVISANPGSGLDLLAQHLSKDLEKELGKPFVVEHKPGAGGANTLNAVYYAEHDGHTILMTTAGYASQVQMLDKIGPKDFLPISTIASSAVTVFAKKGSTFKSLKDVIAYAKANPGKLKAGTGAVGGKNHESIYAVEKATGTDFTIVPLGTSAETVVGVLGGHVDIGFASPATILPQVQAGELVCISILGRDRNPLFPQTKSAKEEGFDIEMGQWRAVVGPSGMPAQAVKILADALEKIQKTAEWKKFLEDNGLENFFTRGKDLDEFMRKQLEGTAGYMAAFNLK